MPVDLIELPHPEEVRARKTPQFRVMPGEVACELVYPPFASSGSLDLPADIFIYLPVEIDKPRVDGLKSPLPGALDKGGPSR